MRLAVIGLASSHVDQIVRLATTGRLGTARLGVLIDIPAEPVPAGRLDLLRAAAGELTGTDTAHLVQEVRAAGCDAALVTTRDPATHRRLAAPLLRAGIPVFVDKPFVADPRDAAALIATAEAAGVLLTSSSALRWHPAVRAAGERWAAEPEGLELRVTGPADPASAWGGRLFLGVHAVEAALGALPGSGDRPRTVRVAQRGDRRIAEVTAGRARAVIDLGPDDDGWRLTGPGLDTALELDADYLRPPLLGFLAAVDRGDPSHVPTGTALLDAARVLVEVCG